MKDSLEEFRIYKMAIELWDLCWKDTEILKKDFRGKEIAKQLIRSCGSISANIEEGFGRGFGKEYPHFLRIARGSARESKGWYKKSKFLLPSEIIIERCNILDGLVGMITKSIETLEKRRD